MFQFLTPEGIVEAAKLIREGKVFRLDNVVGYADPPIGGRVAVKSTVKSYEEYGILAFDDVLDNYNTQEGTQWDGLRHVGFTWEKAFYNGVTPAELKTTSKIGVHKWKDKIVGRGLLIDVYPYCTNAGRKINPMAPETYSLDELKGALKAQAGLRAQAGHGSIAAHGMDAGLLESLARGEEESRIVGERQRLRGRGRLADRGVALGQPRGRAGHGRLRGRSLSVRRAG